MAPKTPATEKLQSNKRGAKPIAAAEVVGAQLDADKLPARHGELVVMAEAESATLASCGQLAESLGYDGQVTVPALMDGIQFYQRRTAEACLEIGKRLLLLKELTQHGGFVQIIDELGFHPRMAQRFMAATLKLTKSDKKSLLAAAGSQSKLLELVVLDDEEIEALENGESVNGIDLDDIEVMSASELKKALREQRADADAKNEVTAKLQQRLEKSETDKAKLRRQFQKATPDEITANLRGDLDTEALQIGASILATDKSVSSLRNRVAALIEHAEAYGEDHSVYLAGLFAQLERHLHRVRDEFFIPRAAVGDPATEAQLTLGEEA